MNDNQFKNDVKSAVKESITELCIIKRIDGLDKKVDSLDGRIYRKSKFRR